VPDNPGLTFARGSHGKILIDRIELVAKGEGKPFPSFKNEDVKTIQTVADFENLSDMGKIITAYMHDVDRKGPLPDFSKGRGNTVARDVWDTAAVSLRVPDDRAGGHVWQLTRMFHEELSFVGIRLPQNKDANGE
jgi:hypothetical protein